MLKLIVVGLVFATVSSAPLESTPSEKPNYSRTQIELVRPSSINPDIPMDPKPPERIILDNTKPERNREILNNVRLPSDDLRESLKSDLTENEPSTDNKQDCKSRINQPNVDNNQSDDKRESVHTIDSNVKDKEVIQPIISVGPTIVYAIKANEKQRSESFETSHRIPNVDGGERNFETSHHIPTHIENERTKSIEYAKIAQKPLN